MTKDQCFFKLARIGERAQTKIMQAIATSIVGQGTINHHQVCFGRVTMPREWHSIVNKRNIFFTCPEISIGNKYYQYARINIGLIQISFNSTDRQPAEWSFKWFSWNKKKVNKD